MSIIYDHDTKLITYQSPSQKIVKEKCNSLISQFMKYAAVHKIAVDDIYIQRILIPRIFIRVDKREGYFMVFHEQTRINEIKQAALVAYWILKYKPFMITSNDPVIACRFKRINEGFAAFYLFSAFKQFATEKKCLIKPMSNRLVDEIMYAFTYWDLSKEAMILIAETIGEAFYGIEAQGMDIDGCNQ